MSAPRISIEDAIEAYDVAERIGAEFKAARTRAGDQQKNVAHRIGIAKETVSRFETGNQKNLKLGSAVRLLRLYNLTLAVVPASTEAA